jgi:SAM-dependent methyltransferase
MTETPRIATRSSGFPDPAEAGRVCELCGGRNFSIMHSWNTGDSWNPAAVPIAMWKCTCGCSFLHPIPTSEQLPGQGDWWSEQRKPFRRRGRAKEIWQKWRFAAIGSNKERFLRRIRRVVPSGRFLDVGCGKGDMLLQARQFYDCVGVEPSAKALDYLKEKGLNLIQGTLETADLEENSFDIVLLDSVIEHVPSPGALLRKAHYVLRSGGIVIVVTPKLNGPSHRLHGAEWNGLRHGYHTFLFTAKTLSQYLRDAGFEVLRRPRRNRIFDDILAFWGRKVVQRKS